MNYHTTKKVLLNALTGCVFGLLLTPYALAQPANIALGKSVVFSAKPNYKLSTDSEDHLQLTDGKYSSKGALQEKENTKALWVQKGTVGWQNVNPLIITIDLGSVQPISGASYSTAAGQADVTWPDGIYILVSDDAKNWKGAGDLVELSRKNSTPPVAGYSPFRYVTHDLKTHGRYIAFAVAGTPYTFADEIEVYAGNQQWLSTPVGGATVTDIKAHVVENSIVSRARQRLRDDASAVRKLVQSASIPAARKDVLIAHLNKQEADIPNLTTLPPDFKTIFPLNETHQNIFAVHGELLALQGFKPLTVWKRHRFAWLDVLTKPEPKQKANLNFSMLGNQFRSDSILLTNAGATPQKVNLKLTNPPKNVKANWFKIDSVEWTDTQSGTAVPDALTPVEAQDETYTITVPAGMTRKVWFTVDSSKVEAGSTQSTLEISDGSTQEQIPVSFNISSVITEKPRLSLGVWDYANGKGLMGVTPQNRDAAIALMRSHYVDSPWATSAALPLPLTTAFDAQGKLIGKLDFTNFDEWIARWPDARRYFVFPNVGDSFAGTKMNTPEFHTRVGSWAKVLSAHMKDLGLKPEQLGILLVDESGSDAKDAIIAAWAKAINAAAPELTLFEDPTRERPDQTKIQEAITEIDIICPMVPIYYKGGEPVKNYFENLRQQGKELWFYQCTGPVRLYDPQLYFRYQAWHTFSIGGTGQGFWSFGDTGKNPSSWNEYSPTTTSFSPAFLDANTVTNSIHWDAVREGMEDYEELAMLQDAIRKSQNAVWKLKAQQVLDDAVKTVTGVWSRNYDWKNNLDSNLADKKLQKVRDMLIAIT